MQFDPCIPLHRLRFIFFDFLGDSTLACRNLFRAGIVTQGRYHYTGVAEWFSGGLQNRADAGSIPASRATF